MKFPPLATLAICILPPTSFLLAQGSLTPPGAPAPTMRSLGEIWDKIGALETQTAALLTAHEQFRAEHRLLSVFLAGASGSLAWQLATVDSASVVGEYSSLAFGPDGQPALSHPQQVIGGLRFARKGLFKTTP